MPNLTPDFLNVSLNGGCVGDRLVHAGAGPRPVFIWLHGGGGSTGDHYRLWLNGNSMNRFASFLNTSSNSNFDVVSLGVPQFENTGPTSAGHLPTMVEATLGITWPDAAARAIQGINHVISLLNPPGVILGGFSWGTLVGGCSMFSTALSGVDGFLGYYSIPDVRRMGPSKNVGGDEHLTCSSVKDMVHHSQVKGVAGQSNEADWLAVQPVIRKTASMRWYIEQGLTSNYREMFLVHAADVGNHSPPYGNGSPGTNVHDSAQHTSLMNALTAASLGFEHFEETTSGSWESAGEGDTINTTVEAWMLERIS